MADETPETKEEREARWWRDWWAADYSWEGLAKKKIVGGGQWSEETLQDYWRRDPETGEMRPDALLKATGQLIEFQGRWWHVAHLPEVSQNHEWSTWKSQPTADEWVRLSAIINERQAVAKETFGEYARATRRRRLAFQPLGADRRARLDGCVIRDFPTLPVPRSQPHHSSWDRVAFLDDIDCGGATFGSGAGFNETAFFGDVEFDDAVFSGESCFDGSVFFGNAGFDSSTYRGNAWFVGVDFHGYIDFDGSVFLGDSNFEKALIRARASFGRLAFNKIVNFNGAIFSEDSSFDSAVFSAHASFNRTIFAGNADFENARFSQSASFNGVNFAAGVSFDGSAFSESASFSGVSCSGDVSFQSVAFATEAGFGGAVFSEEANFSRATFAGIAGFRSTVFTGDSYFEGTAFRGLADFERVNFAGETFFRSAVFSDYANFYGAEFSRNAEFNNVNFSTEAAFKDVVFSGAVHFDGAHFLGPVYLENAVFSGEAEFESATFSGYANFDGSQFTKGAVFSGGFEHGGSFRNTVFERQVTFAARVDQPEERFAGAFYGARFADIADFSRSGPLRSGVSDRNDGARMAIAFAEALFEKTLILTDGSDSVSAKAFRNGTIKYIRTIPSGEGRDGVLDRLEAGCRTVKIAMGKARDEAREQRYYRFQLQARHARADTHWSEKFFGQLYGAVSDYGASLGRPLACLAGLIVASGLIYWLWASGLRGETVFAPFSMEAWGNVASAVSFSFGRALFLSAWLGVPEKDQTTWQWIFLHGSGPGWGLLIRFVAALQSILSGVLIFLFALAVRRRFQIGG